MRTIYLLVLPFIVGFVMNGCGGKAGGMQKLSIQSALSDKSVNGNIDPNIKLSFGDNGGSGKEWTANKKTNGVNKSISEACNRAFVSAVISLQDRARKEGKNSVVDIYSFYKKNKFSSSSEFECEDGKIMSGVTLKGKVQ